MPELPEVETIARTLSPQIQGRCVTAVSVLHPKVLQAGKELLPLLRNAVIERVSRRAKLLILHMRPEGSKESPFLLLFHLKMTGSFFVHPEGTEALKHTRLIFDLEGGGRLFFDDVRTFGYCRIYRPEQLSDWDFWTSLGPEPLDGSVTDLAEHLEKAFAGRRSAVKAALLDQRVVAGVGNIYADESLFKAGILPSARASDIPGKRLLSLASALRDILRLSIEECGSSIRDYRDALGNAGAFQNSFAVYGRKGEPCRSCGRPLEHVKIGGRSTVFCPACQK